MKCDEDICGDGSWLEMEELEVTLVNRREGRQYHKKVKSYTLQTSAC